jgi:transcriptional regulator with XRE-family HTH domain
MSRHGFADSLKRLRAERGLSQSELAERAGLSQNGISQWEAGTREPSWSNVLALAAALGVPCTAFTAHAAEASAPLEGSPPPADRPQGKGK